MWTPPLGLSLNPIYFEILTIKICKNRIFWSSLFLLDQPATKNQMQITNFLGSTKMLMFCFCFDFFSPDNQNFVKTLTFHLCLSKHLVFRNQNLAFENQNLGFLKLISFDFPSILGFLSLLSHATTQGLLIPACYTVKGSSLVICSLMNCIELSVAAESSCLQGWNC